MAEEQAPAAEVKAPLTARGMRARLARVGTKAPSSNPVLEPLFRAVKANHPKADLALLERAYAEAELLRGPHLASLAFELNVTIELVLAYQRLLRQGAVPIAAA